MAGNATLEATHHNGSRTGFPIRAFTLIGRILMETTRL